jgi:protein-disulfide isomerase
MKIASTVFLLLTLSAQCVVSAQRSRGRSVRQPAAKPAPSKPTTQPAAESVPTPSAPTAPVPPVLLATVNGQNITTADLEPSVRAEVESLPARTAEARRTILEMEINTLLLDSEANRRKLTSQQLYDLEVAKKIAKPTATEIDTFIANNRGRIDEPNPAVLREQVEGYLSGEREDQLSKALVARLRLSHKVVMGVDVNTPNLAPSALLATVGSRPITSANISERLKPIIYRLRLNSYQVQKSALDVTINDLLLLAEANRQNLAPEQIVRKEVTDKAGPPTEAEVTKFYEDNKSRIDGDFASVKNQIASYLQQESRQKLERGLSDRLRKGANIRILLAEPERPVQAISVDDDPSKGDANAPVTVIVFTDFQCPSCAATHPVIDDVLNSYGNTVRLVVRDFPLNQHANARKAAEAANAAHAQGKFFEYAALLFKRQNALDVGSLKKYATEVGLNRAAFDAALDSGKYAAEVTHDLKDGELYGVESTPTIFVNGVSLPGLSADLMRAAIDRALTASKAAPKSSQ